VIRNLFDQTRATYIRLQNGRFRIGNREAEAIEATIRDLVPVRKLFDGTRLDCWSVNGARGRDQRLCAFCPDTARCQKRLRLHLILNGDDTAEIPAVLEVRASAFAALDTAIESLGSDDAWRNTLFRISLEPGPDGRDRLAFRPLF
jgi:hypothetical protein